MEPIIVTVMETNRKKTPILCLEALIDSNRLFDAPTNCTSFNTLKTRKRRSIRMMAK